jgi:glycosyltransferase involved in cell wall biosynthesis
MPGTERPVSPQAAPIRRRHTGSAMKILIATDAWLPQVNGVVRTFKTIVAELESLGHRVEVIGPDRFRTLPMPSYPEIRLAVPSKKRLAQMVDAFGPDAVHIPVEGPIGVAMRRLCIARGWPFSSSFHTHAGRYFELKFGVPERVVTAMQRRFHAASSAFMVQTTTLERDLAASGFANIRSWTRGVDTEFFRPLPPDDRTAPELAGRPRPYFAYVGRVSAEKNLEAFFELDLPGTKLVVGDGPQLAAYRAAWPEVVFAGLKSGADLVRHYAIADAFVFPSRFETFGLVLLEALACGVPVAALPVPGPLDVIGTAPVGVLGEDLRTAALEALEIPRTACRAFAEQFSWRRSAEQFVSHLVPIDILASARPQARTAA